jgi:uncharacterized protein (TIGR02569 family)
MSEEANSAPPRQVLQAFGVCGKVERLTGGQGNVFACGDVVVKPVADSTEAIWVARTQLSIEPRGFRLARPIASASGSFVVAGWTAWSRLRGEHRLHEGAWPRVVELCARFHDALRQVPRPAFFDRRQNNFARADRIAWNELAAPLSPEICAVIEPLASKVQPCRHQLQLIHGDFAGNVLFADGCEPAVIDLSPYWRPARYAIALTIVDAVLWYGGSLDLLDELRHFEDRKHLVARALIFRLAIDGLFALDQPGAFWSAAIARDLTGARPLLQYIQR